MAFNRSITQRLMGLTRAASPALTNCRISNPRSAFKSPVLNQSSPSQLASDPKDDGIFRRYLHRQSAAQQTEFRFLPTGEKLLERIRDIGIGKDRVKLDGLIPPPEEAPEELSVMDAKKILKVSQLEMVKERLREVERDTVSYTEFLEICSRDCPSFDQGLEFAKMLDQSGSVILLQNNTVHLRPEKVGFIYSLFSVKFLS